MQNNIIHNKIINRTLQERQLEVRKIVKKLNELHLNTSYDAIKTLFENMQTYINNNEKIDINIPFPDMNVNIKGVLEIDRRKKVWVKLESLQKSDENNYENNEENNDENN